MKKWMIMTIVIVYTFLIGLIIYYSLENKNREKNLTKKIEVLEKSLKEYYENKYDNEDLGKIFLFPGETNIEFDDTGLSGSAFIYSDGTIEIALYDGKYCGYKKENLEIKKMKIEECVVNKAS